MSKQIDKEIIEDIAIEIGISPSFVEKDYYAVKILNELSKIEYENAKLIFTGGTCLSKAYNLIKRFSEDIDFRINTNSPFIRGKRKEFREFIIQNIKNIPDIEIIEESLEKKNESQFFSFYVTYPKHFTLDNALRDGLKLEFTFENVLLTTNTCKIESIISKYIDKIEISKMDCISPIEIGADKLSALMWRIDIKDRTKHGIVNDATIIRHLHDLAALEKLIMNDDFINSVHKSLESDKGRGGSSKDINLIEYAEKTLSKLKTDKIYSKEYKDFVDALSYANESETIDFKTALASFERIVDFIKNTQYSTQYRHNIESY